MSKKKVFSVSIQNKTGEEISSATLKPSQRYLTVGERLDNDLSVSIPGIPNNHRLLETIDSKYSLIIPPTLDGIIYRENDKNSIHTKALIKRPGLKKKEGSYVIPVTPGRPFSMKVGDITLSFSYNELPSKVRPAGIERSLKRSLISKEDYSFLLLLIVSAAINFSIAGYLNTVEIKKLEHIEVMAQMPERFAKLIFKPAERKIEKKIAKAKAEEKKEEEKAEKKQEEAKKDVKKESKTETAAAKEPAAKESAGSRIKSKGLLGVITAKEKPIFASQNIFDIEAEEVPRSKMASIQDARAAGGTSDVVRRLDNIELDSGDRKSASKSRDIGDILKEKKVASIVLEDGKPKGTETKGGRNEAEVDKSISTYTGGVKYLYNNALRNDPSLKGKITVKLTISERGKVTKVEIVSSTLNNKELEDAIMNRIYKWQFSEAIGAGDFVITYAFDFSPTS